MEKSQKVAKKFCCIPCDYSSSNKADYTKHLSTQKHFCQSEAINYDVNVAKNRKKSQEEYSCEKCNIKYKDYSGLWRHKKKCEKEPDSNLVIQLLKQNDEFKHLIIGQNKTILEQNSHLIEVCKNGIINNSVTQVNSNNKTFNLNVFLNEDCKDAMNITDFVDSIKFQLADLEHMGQVGYVDGISNIILKNLKALDVTKRPVHCTDQKRETIYIKDGGVWTKEEEDNKNVRKLIKKVAFRNSKCLSLFKEKYPDCITSESRYSDTYSKIVIEAMGGGSKCNDYESENKIIRKIAKEMTIDKSNFEY
jgi:hypothetical protein